eukprot:CAMPEP_0195643198 /NCGR_PEP_ID=MMETSP0815-20121206/27705_1 /TAXON_ID=97485 /ORGANISM="Prymnesium parvum, Strain Texoma1" /LENGTH=139 /DNA_ID=CAMNT_0040786219 /DNA_START=452 /DNA_END=869 /DNA_ORIENTATION=+
MVCGIEADAQLEEAPPDELDGVSIVPVEAHHRQSRRGRLQPVELPHRGDLVERGKGLHHFVQPHEHVINMEPLRLALLHNEPTFAKVGRPCLQDLAGDEDTARILQQGGRDLRVPRGVGGVAKPHVGVPPALDSWARAW